MRPRILIAVAGLALVAGACSARPTDVAVSSTASASSPVLELRAAGERSAAETTGKFEVSVSVASLATIKATGAFDGPAAKTHVSIDLGALSALAGGDGQPLEVITDGDTAYAKLGALAALAERTGGATTPWVSAELPKGASAGIGSITVGSRSLIDALQGVAGEVTTKGTEDVRGVSTTHYAATIDLTKALDAVPADQRSQLEDRLKTAGVDLSKLAIPVDVWVDDDGLVRRLTATLDTTALAGVAPAIPGVRVDETLEVFDYGQPVDITVPAADQVTDVGGLAGLFG